MDLSSWTELVVRHRCGGPPVGQAVWCQTPEDDFTGWALWHERSPGHWIVAPLVRLGVATARTALESAAALDNAPDRVLLPSRHSKAGAGHVLMVDTTQPGRHRDDGRRVDGHRFSCRSCRADVPVKAARMQRLATDAARRGERSVLV